MPETDINHIYQELHKINARLDKLTDVVNQSLAHDARNSQRLLHNELSTELAHSRISTVKKWLISALIAVASLVLNYAWNVITHAKKG